MSRLYTALLLAVCAGGCGEPDGPESTEFVAAGEAPAKGRCTPALAPGPFPDCVDDFAPAGEASFGHDALPEIVLAAPHGSPMGGADVASLGCGGRITLYFAEAIVDGPGPDFTVFENPFNTGSETFAEPARVLVSDDGQTWFGFPCEVDGTGAWPPTGCAGIEPVHANGTTPAPTDPAVSGGDVFDLADIAVSEAHYVRLVDVTREYFGNEMWCAGEAAGFDLDAVSKVEVD